MSGFKFRFACSNANMPDNKNVFSNQNKGITFAFEFEATHDDDLFQGYQSALPQKSTPPRLNHIKQNGKGSSIIWHASRYSKFIDRISFNVEGHTNLEFINGDNQLYLHWENGGVTRLKKEHIESILLLEATNGKLGMVQCTIYENVLDYGTGPAILRTYIDETHPLNVDVAEISELLTEAGFEVISK